MKSILFDCDSTLGITEEAPDTCKLNLPEVTDTARYRQEMYAGWLSFQLGERP